MESYQLSELHCLPVKEKIELEQALWNGIANKQVIEK